MSDRFEIREHLLQPRRRLILNALQNPLSLAGRVLLAALFIPAGFGKIAGFAGTVGYITSKGLPLPTPT